MVERTRTEGQYRTEEILARLDERTLAMQKDIIVLKSDFEDKQEKIEKTIETFIQKADLDYVKTEQFIPVRLFVYGLIGLILTGVGAAILSLVINTSSHSAVLSTVAG